MEATFDHFFPLALISRQSHDQGGSVLMTSEFSPWRNSQPYFQSFLRSSMYNIYMKTVFVNCHYKQKLFHWHILLQYEFPGKQNQTSS